MVEKETKGLDVGLLVNNAATWITLFVLANMLKKKKGAIINICSSSTMVIPSYPLYTVYAAFFIFS